MQQYTVPILKTPLDIQVKVPGSKSITNRAFLLAALSEGKSVLHDPLKSDDTKYMKAALEELGIKVEETEKSFIVHGKGGGFKEGDKKLFLGNAGTAVRFLSAAMALRKGKTVVDGIERMRQRPIQDLCDGLEQIGAKVLSNKGCPPLEIWGIDSSGRILRQAQDDSNKSVMPTIRMSGSQSSQYFSALMHIAPLLPNGLNIKVEGDLVSKPYIDITIGVMASFGVKVENHNYQKFSIAPQKYQACEYAIEGDASAASYWFGLAAVTGSKITVANLAYNSLQGDAKFVDVLEKMGCHLEKSDKGISVIGPKNLKALGEINMNAMPDVAMTLAIIATCADGETIIQDVANMRIKETDRIKALVTELRKMGVKAEALPDGLIVHGTKNQKGAEIETYDDHRMAMCFAVLGAVTPGTVILDPDCCRKTYPSFFQEWDLYLQ
jgi:3-phosphoshikimate 1-carboxyvinyltransferase